MTEPEAAIEIHQGNTNILLIAPHGHPDDDKNTGTIVRQAAEQNGYYAIINETYRKPDDQNNDPTANKENKRVNLNRTRQVEEHLKEEFLDRLIAYKDEIVKKHDKALLLWIHGAENASVRNDVNDKVGINPKEIKILIGYGQDADEVQQRHTAPIGTVQKIISGLNQVNIKAVPANDTIRQQNLDKKKEDRQKSFCAWDRHNMNQFFRVGEYHDPNVESIQLEFRMKDCRDTDENIEATARNLGQAISPLVSSENKEASTEEHQEDTSGQDKTVAGQTSDSKSSDGTIEIEDPVVERAYLKLAQVFSKNYEQALMEAGQYIVRTFYGCEEGIEDQGYQEDFPFNEEVIENARCKTSPLESSLRQLCAKIEGEKSGNTPSQAWIYNAVNLVVQEYDLKKELKSDFYTYGSLILSHKITLLKIKEMPQKLELIREAAGNHFTAVSFKKRVAESLPAKETRPIALSTLLKKPEELVKDEFADFLSLPTLKGKGKKTLANMKILAEEQSQSVESDIENLKKRIEEHNRYLGKYAEVKANLEKAIKSKGKKAKKKPAKRKPQGPQIISVSRRTDIPALYSDWFFNRIKEGFATYRKDLTVKPKKVSLKPEDVRCLVFWTKNPEPMLSRLDELEGYQYYFQFTLTPYDKTLEPHLPPKDKLVETFIRLSETIGKDRVIWRYDPILLTDEINVEYHKKHFAELAERLHKYTEKCNISFISSMKNVSDDNKNILKLNDTSPKVKRELAKELHKIASRYDLQIQACAQTIDYSDVHIVRSTCIDGNFIGNLIGKKFDFEKDPSQRKHCQCAESVDIGTDETCIHGCFFCYATHDHTQAKLKYKRHNKNSPLLIGTPEDRDVVIWEIKNNEWTLSKNNVNFSTGCSNNCLYCYGRYMPYARNQEKKAKDAGQTWHWSEPIIRENHVNRKQTRKDGRVGFPTSHDITSDNLNESMIVLGKLLEAGNDVMVISKPHLDCIKAICEKFQKYKDKILFRFTIGGKSEDILNFWEPKAPSYAERFEALKHAYAQGYQTSVSMEPMLEYDRVQEMVDDFMPYVSDAIWFGKMNHIPAFKDPDGRLEAELAKVEAGHSDDNIRALYEIYKDNSQIKWKLAFKEVLGIPLPPAPGMDV